ncbi:hypothetical protein BD770DRAFT_473240 [Pilaira anomala]|nr:hypothetical protein BD770DRAFT_473240 [Pilaira anomala]
MTDCFNPEPIMLRNPTSLLASEDQIKQDQQMIEIAQHLAPEQFKYEFPPKSRILEIEAEIQYDDEFSYFDECSFTTTSISTAAYSNIIMQQQEDDVDEEEEEDEEYYHQLMTHSARSSSDRLDRYFESFTNEHGGNAFLADNQLSPLQLPTQMHYNPRHIREESYDSTGTVTTIRKSSQYSTPSSFLSESSSSSHHHHLACVAEEDRIHWDENSFVFPDHHHQQQQQHFIVHENVYRPIHPYRMDSRSDIFHDDNISHSSNNSKVIVIKISKSQPAKVIQQYPNSFISTSDEGYDDEEPADYDDCKELPIESASVFLPLSEYEQEQLMDLETIRQLAAIKIQSVWRGYQSRQKTSKPSYRVWAGLARVNDSIHRRNYHQLQDRCYELEQRLGVETAMRITFEKAMEDMTIVMDHQHKVLNERVEQEVDMRQAYEQKMDHVLNQVQPLEQRLRHETKARAEMESMMSRVLDQLHDIKVQQKEDAEHRKLMELKLEEATKEIALLKKSNVSRTTTTTTTISSSSRRPATATASTRPTTTVNKRPATATSTRPSMVPTTRPATSNAQRITPSPVPRTKTPIRSQPPTLARPTTRLSNRTTTPTITTEKKSTTPLRKTVINRKL